ncbi:HU family DNA-binding protein, partial [Candidatus Aerophobetes bacterium]|nr:HU family DNA-binding protein [Candidatus Aerophobetes bacterium]
MNKAQLIGEVANQTGLTRKAVRQTLDAMTSAIARALAQGEKVTLVGFG